MDTKNLIQKAKKEVFDDIEKSKVIYDLPLDKDVYCFLNKNRYKKIKKKHLKQLEEKARDE